MLCARQIDFLLCQRTWFVAILLWLNGVPASHTGVRQTLPPAHGASQTGTAGRTLDACMETTAYPGHSSGLLPPWGLTSNRKEAQPRAKAKPDACKSKSGKKPLWEKGGALELQGRLSGAGGAGVGLTLRNGMQTSSPRITWISA